MDWVQENEWANDQEKISAMEERIAELEAQVAAADRLAEGCNGAIEALNLSGSSYQINAAKELRRCQLSYRATKGVM